MSQDLGEIKLLPGQTIVVSADKPPKVNYNAAKTRVRVTAQGTYVEAPAPTPDPPSPPVGSGARAMGVYIHGSAYDYSLLDAHSAQVGHAPGFATIYAHWGTSAGSEWPQPWINAMVRRGITPLITWEAWNNYTGSSDPAFSLDSTLNHQHDAVLDRWITGAKAYGKPVYIRLAHEMNGNWYPWGFQGGHNGNTPAKSVAFWRYVVDRFRAAGANNVKWVWSPNIVENDKPITGSYPGDAYVDVMGIDGYNWGTSQSWSHWYSFTTTIGPTYTLLAALGSRPIIIAETASTELGGNKAQWITDGYGLLPTAMPRIVGVLWFSQNKETDWRVDSSGPSLTAYRSVAAQASWQGKL